MVFISSIDGRLEQKKECEEERIGRGDALHHKTHGVH